jgi:hypothetical protein
LDDFSNLKTIRGYINTKSKPIIEVIEPIKVLRYGYMFKSSSDICIIEAREITVYYWKINLSW